jgi:hypothetical protein
VCLVQVRLWVNNALLVDQWASLDALAATAATALPSLDGYYEFSIEYRHPEVGAGYGCRLEWVGASSAEVVPSARLFVTEVGPTQALHAGPADASVASSTASGPGISLSTAGVGATFTITARDEYGNERDSQGAVFITDGPGISGVPTIPSLLAEYPARYTPRLAGQAYLAVALLRGGGLTGSYHDNGIPPPPSLPY